MRRHAAVGFKLPLEARVRVANGVVPPGDGGAVVVPASGGIVRVRAVYQTGLRHNQSILRDFQVAGVGLGRFLRTAFPCGVGSGGGGGIAVSHTGGGGGKG